MNRHHDKKNVQAQQTDNGTASVVVIATTMLSLGVLLMASVASAVTPTIEYMLALV